MYLIDETYFIKNIKLPNILEMDSSVLSELNIYIDQYARQFLKDALGYELYKDFDSNIENGVLKVNALQKWKNLLNGVEYDGKKWQGLIYTEGLYKHSILANFVFYHYVNDNVTTLTSFGETSVNTQNSSSVNPNQRLVTIWNEFVSENQLLQNDTLFCYSEKYGIPFYDWYNRSNNKIVSLLQFLEDNKIDYPTANMKEYRFKNQFGL